MANKRIDTVQISKEIILRNIRKAGLSIRKLAEKTDRSERTIRMYLERGQMPDQLVRQIDNVLRPKTNWVCIQTQAWIAIADNELKDILARACEGGGDPDHLFHDVELDTFEAEALWELKGDVQFLGGRICKDHLVQYREFAEKASILMETNSKNKEDAKNGKGKV